MKILLAKQPFVYYLHYQKEFATITRIFKSFLIFFFVFFAFQSVVFAGSKESSAREYHLKGYEAQQKGNLQDALSFYIKAASLSEENPAILNDVAICYEKLGMPEKAEENYLRAIAVDPDYLPAYSNLAYFYARQDNIPRAIEFFKQRIELGDADDPWTQRAKDDLLSVGEDFPVVKKWLLQQEAVELSQKLIEKSRKDFYNNVEQSQKCVQAAQKLELKKKYREAVEQYNKALSFTPENPKIIKAKKRAMLRMAQEEIAQHYGLAMKSLDMGDTASALVEFRYILTLIPNEPVQVSE
ncbi:MAG: tetratricopeptide repeat protein [Candidatus Omnitrophota bacterium]